MSTSISLQNLNPMAQLSVCDELKNVEYELFRDRTVQLVSMVAFAALAIGTLALLGPSYGYLTVFSVIPTVFTGAFVPFVYDPLSQSIGNNEIQCKFLKNTTIPYTTETDKQNATVQMRVLGAPAMTAVENRDAVFEKLFNVYLRHQMALKAIEECEKAIHSNKECYRAQEGRLSNRSSALEDEKRDRELTSIRERIHHLQEEDNLCTKVKGLAKTKIFAAYCLHILRNPQDKSDLASFGEITPRSFDHRKVFENDTYFYHKDGARLDRSLFLENDVQTIADRIFAN